MKDLIYIHKSGQEVKEFNLGVQYAIINTAAGVIEFKEDVYLFGLKCDDEEIYIPDFTLKEPCILELCEELRITDTGKEVYYYDFYDATNDLKFIKENFNWG